MRCSRNSLGPAIEHGSPRGLASPHGNPGKSAGVSLPQDAPLGGGEAPSEPGLRRAVLRLGGLVAAEGHGLDPGLRPSLILL